MNNASVNYYHLYFIKEAPGGHASLSVQLPIPSSRDDAAYPHNSCNNLNLHHLLPIDSNGGGSFQILITSEVVVFYSNSVLSTQVSPNPNLLATSIFVLYRDVHSKEVSASNRRCLCRCWWSPTHPRRYAQTQDSIFFFVCVSDDGYSFCGVLQRWSGKMIRRIMCRNRYTLNWECSCIIEITIRLGF